MPRLSKSLFTVITLPLIIAADSTIDITKLFQPANLFNNAGNVRYQGVGGLGTLIYSAIFGFGIVIAFILIIVGGIKIITSGGEPNGIAAGRKTITYAIIGVVALMLPWLIIYLIQAFIKTAGS